jgi:hypothetical protein
MPTHATALFADRHSAHAAVEQLAQAGFARDELTVAMAEDAHEREFGAASTRSSGIGRVGAAPYASGVLPAIVAGLKSVEAPDVSPEVSGVSDVSDVGEASGVNRVSAGAPLRVGGPLLDALLRARSLTAALGELGLDAREARAVRDGLRLGQIVVGVHGIEERVALARQLLELAGGEATKAA